MNDSLFLGGWSMCGREYHLLISDNKITAVLAFPTHSRRHPGIFGTCTVRGKALKDGVLAVLDNPAPRAKGQPPYSPEDTTSLAASAAWRIDEKNRQFRELRATTVRCPRGQISTIDGGMWSGLRRITNGTADKHFFGCGFAAMVANVLAAEQTLGGCISIMTRLIVCIAACLVGVGRLGAQPRLIHCARRYGKGSHSCGARRHSSDQPVVCRV